MQTSSARQTLFCSEGTDLEAVPWLDESEDTVKHHLSNIFDKLGVFSRLELAVFAFNNSLVQDDRLLIGKSPHV